MSSAAWLCLMLVGALPAASPSLERVSATWQQPPLIRLGAQEPLSVGLAQVLVDEEVLQHPALPPPLRNVSGLLLREVRRAFEGQGEVAGLTDLGLQAWLHPAPTSRILRELQGEDRPAELSLLTLDPWPGTPLGVRASLLSVVRVLAWYVRPTARPGQERVSIVLFLSTATREGRPVHAEVVFASGQAGGPPEVRSLETKALSEAELGTWWPASGRLSESWLEAFQQVLRVAVSHHYAPFLAHPRSEVLELFNGPGLEAGTAHVRRGEYVEALQAYALQASQQPTDARALYNAALLHGLHGEEARALELLGQARELQPGEPFASAWRRALGRRVFSQRLAEPVPPAAPSAQAEDWQCWEWESAPLGDIRWGRRAESTLLADYHPGRCAGAGRACVISRYWIRFHLGLWSAPFHPGVDDEHPKTTYEGARQRALAMFADHRHRYEYCVQVPGPASPRSGPSAP